MGGFQIDLGSVPAVFRIKKTLKQLNQKVRLSLNRKWQDNFANSASRKAKTDQMRFLGLNDNGYDCPKAPMAV